MKLIDLSEKEQYLFITPNSYKMKLLKILEQQKSIYHIQFLTKKELKKNLLYEYHPQTLWKYADKFKMTLENANKELEALYEVKDETLYPDLYQKKNWLYEQGLMIEHIPFLQSLKNKIMIVWGYDFYEMKDLESIIKEYCQIHCIKEEGTFFPTIMEYEWLEQEVVGVAEKITQLLKQGILIEHIYIGSLSSEYRSVIYKIFSMFQIPLQTKEKHNLYEYAMIQELLKKIDWKQSLKEVSDLLLEMESLYPKENPFYANIYEQLITIINRYYDETLCFSDIRDIFIHELKHTKVKEEHYKNVVREVDFFETYFEKEDYIFLMGNNLGQFPTIYQDQEYFKDDEKKNLKLLTSLEKTIGEEQKLVRKIQSLEHVFISYKKKSPYQEYLPSTFIENWKEHNMIEIKHGTYGYTNYQYNMYLLNSSLDDFVKYQFKNEHLQKRYGLEPLYYQTYQNQFQPISKEVWNERVKKCLLSYTGMQKYFECPFKFYVNSILKINPPFEETPSLIVGNLFHSVLETYFKTKQPLDDIINSSFSTIQIKPKEKRIFYLEKYRKEIKRLIQLIEKQQSQSSFKATYFEESIFFDEERTIKFRLYGKVDKIMTFEDEKYAYIIVVDYKTGHASSDLSKIVYGMNMQLLLYLYLISKDERFSKYQLGGSYIQSISASIPNYTEGKTVEELLFEQSKLDGFTLKRSNLVEKLDHEYQSSSYIKGIRVKSDGEFYANNRLLDESVLEQLLEIVHKNIETIKQAIENASFLVEPKRFTSEPVGNVSSCSYCDYRDICYLNPKNIVTLKEYKNLEFLGGENYDSKETN